jgi:hypothetical protein
MWSPPNSFTHLSTTPLISCADALPKSCNIQNINMADFMHASREQRLTRTKTTERVCTP